MNKGVELLRARRETNPEEFVISLEDDAEDSRWFNLLAEHDVDLDNPDAKILKPRVFAREVMNRLLTASDLKPKSALTIHEITQSALQVLEDQLVMTHRENLRAFLNER